MSDSAFETPRFAAASLAATSSFASTHALQARAAHPAPAGPGARLQTVHSPYGHDGFLIEVDQIAAVLAPLLRP